MSDLLLSKVGNPEPWGDGGPSCVIYGTAKVLISRALVW